MSQSCKPSELQIQVRRFSKVQYILTEMDTTYTLKWLWIRLEKNICFSFWVKSTAQYYHYSFLMDFKTLCLQGQWCYHFTDSSIQIDKQTKTFFRISRNASRTVVEKKEKSNGLCEREREREWVNLSLGWLVQNTLFSVSFFLLHHQKTSDIYLSQIYHTEEKTIISNLSFI